MTTKKVFLSIHFTVISWETVEIRKLDSFEPLPTVVPVLGTFS